MVALTASQVPFSVRWGLYGQNNYQIARLPKKAAALAEDLPGFISWGDAGTLPAPTPAVGPTIKMESENNREISRTEKSVRIENPDDPNQYIMANRAREIIFQKTSPYIKGNTSYASNSNIETPTSHASLTSYLLPADEISAAAKKGVKFTFNDDPGSASI